MESLAQQIKALQSKNQELSQLENRLVQLKQQLKLQESNNHIIQQKVNKILETKESTYQNQRDLLKQLEQSQSVKDANYNRIRIMKQSQVDETMKLKQQLSDDKLLRTLTQKQNSQILQYQLKKLKDEELYNKQYSDLQQNFQLLSIFKFINQQSQISNLSFLCSFSKHLSYIQIITYFCFNQGFETFQKRFRKICSNLTKQFLNKSLFQISEWEFQLKQDLEYKKNEKIEKIRAEQLQYKAQLSQKLDQQQKYHQKLQEEEQQLLSKLHNSQSIAQNLRQDLSQAQSLSIKFYNNSLTTLSSSIKSYSVPKLTKKQLESPYAQIPAILKIKINKEKSYGGSENFFPCIEKPSYQEQQKYMERLYQSRNQLPMNQQHEHQIQKTGIQQFKQTSQSHFESQSHNHNSNRTKFLSSTQTGKQKDFGTITKMTDTNRSNNQKNNNTQQKDTQEQQEQKKIETLKDPKDISKKEDQLEKQKSLKQENEKEQPPQKEPEEVEENYEDENYEDEFNQEQEEEQEQEQEQQEDEHQSEQKDNKEDYEEEQQ